MATHAVRAAGPSTSTLALAGVGVFCLANPEKALQLLQRALLVLAEAQGTSGSSSGLSHNASPTPIVIHAGGNAGSSGSHGGGLYALAVQLSVGAGLCWGSYALLVNILPEQAKNMLPVTQGTFKTAVTSLGKGLVSVKDSLSAEIANLFSLQTELQAKQDDTHEQVLYVQDQVSDVHDDLGRLAGNLEDCQARLVSQDKRTTYIARGIRLVTAGMTALLPENDSLMQELQTFNKNSEGASANIVAPRRKSEDVRRSRSSDGASASSRRSQSSRRSRRSATRRSTSAGDAELIRNKPSTSNNNMCFPSEDTLSVSTGTPIRNITIPRKSSSSKKACTASDDSIVPPSELKELDEVRALLERMDGGSNTMPIM